MTYDERIQRMAEKIVNKPDKDGKVEVFIDPVTIMLICSILSAVFNGIRMLRTWRKSKVPEDGAQEIISECIDNSSLFRRFIRNVIKETAGILSKTQLTQTTNDVMSSIAQMTPCELVSIVEKNRTNGV